jgi:hypothetical protein
MVHLASVVTITSIFAHYSIISDEKCCSFGVGIKLVKYFSYTAFEEFIDLQKGTET